MDVAKYIGLFLLKNKYCWLQGLGNLEIKKIPSKHNGTELTGAAYVAKLNPVGSVDDTFPTFVAASEQISISRASNEISEFIKDAKVRLAEGGTVAIPAIGHYVMQNNLLRFELDKAFSLPDNNLLFPIITGPKFQEVTNQERSEIPGENFSSYSNFTRPPGINWNIIAFWGIMLIIFGSILGWTINYIVKQKAPSEQTTADVQKPVTTPGNQTPAAPPAVTAPDVVNQSNLENPPVPASEDGMTNFIIKEYKSLAQAQRKERQLNSYGYSVHVTTFDSMTFYVIQPLKVAPADTTRVKDSLTVLLNPSGVRIMQ